MAHLTRSPPTGSTSTERHPRIDVLGAALPLLLSPLGSALSDRPLRLRLVGSAPSTRFPRIDHFNSALSDRPLTLRLVGSAPSARPSWIGHLRSTPSARPLQNGPLESAPLELDLPFSPARSVPGYGSPRLDYNGVLNPLDQTPRLDPFSLTYLHPPGMLGSDHKLGQLSFSPPGPAH